MNALPKKAFELCFLLWQLLHTSSRKEISRYLGTLVSHFLSSNGSGRKVSISPLKAMLLCLTLSACATGQNTPSASTSLERRAQIRLQLGADYYSRGNYHAALSALEEAKSINPNLPEVYGVLGLIRMDMGDHANAESAFLQGLKLAPKNSELHNNYGWYLCQTKREQEALSHFFLALSDPLYPTPGKPLHNAGICSRKLKQLSNAEDYFLRALQVDPGDPIALYNLAEISLEKKQPDKAKTYVDQLLKMTDPIGTQQILFLALKIAVARKDVAGAQSLYERLSKILPHSKEADRLMMGIFGGEKVEGMNDPDTPTKK